MWRFKRGAVRKERSEGRCGYFKRKAGILKHDAVVLMRDVARHVATKPCEIAIAYFVLANGSKIILRSHSWQKKGGCLLGGHVVHAMQTTSPTENAYGSEREIGQPRVYLPILQLGLGKCKGLRMEQGGDTLLWMLV